MNVAAVMEGKTMTTGLLEIGDGTIFQVVRRQDGAVRTYDAPSFLSGHIVNAFEDAGDIVIDLSWYHADENFMFYGGFLFANLIDKEIRDTQPNSILKRFRLKPDNTIEESMLLNEKNDTTMELPKVSEKVHGSKYCIFYAMHTHSYDYGSDLASRVAGPFGAVGVAKRNLCTGEVQGLYVSNEYPAETEFIPNPRGVDEDDGVLIGLVYDGNSDTSFFQVIDAKTMRRIAKAPLPVNIPFPVHVSFFPSDARPSVV